MTEEARPGRRAPRGRRIPHRACRTWKPASPRSARPEGLMFLDNYSYRGTSASGRRKVRS